MAAPGGTTDPDLNQALILEMMEYIPFEFQFFQAVRLLERAMPDRMPVGRFHLPSREVVRFGAFQHFAFPASQIHEVKFRENGPPKMLVNFMGLTGPMGVMPLYYTELIMERQRSRDHGVVEFLDIFNHRMISLFYQAWEKYRFTVAYERGELDRFSHHLLDLIGMGTKGLQNRLAVMDDTLMFYSGLLSMQPRSAQALKQILVDYFEVPVEIEQFIGSWYPLEAADQCRFTETSCYSEQLGVGAVVGDEVWEVQFGIRIVLGPLTLNQYRDFLPNGSAYLPMRTLARFFAGRETDYELQLVLKRDEVPACELGDESDTGPQLGWLTWNKTVPMGRDPRDTVLRI
jgi:type VI secretion system protein ImpH